MKNKINNFLFMVSAILVLGATVLYMSFPFIMQYVFAIGAAGYAVARLSVRYECDNLRLKRLVRIQKLPGMLLVLASYLMFKPMLLGDKNAWLILVSIAAFIEVYTCFVIEAIDKQNKKASK